MNHHDPINRNSESTPDALDPLLIAHFAPGEELAPSSGFALSVMEAVRAASTAPPPIAFPWKRALPGAIAVLCAMAGFALLLLRLWRGMLPAGVTSAAASAIGPQTAFHLTPVEQACGWIAVAVLLSLAVATGSMRLARGR